LNEDDRYFYYGTANLNLDVKIMINPKYEAQKKFEFGNGFYLTPYKNVAKDYARSGILKNYLENMDEENDDNIKALIDGTIFKAHIHKYEVDVRKIKDGKLRTCMDIDSYKKVIRDTIDGYRSNEKYWTNYDYTYGILCGRYWDENIELQYGFEEKCAKNMMKTINENNDEVYSIQLCLHNSRSAIINHTYEVITDEIDDSEEDFEDLII